jgi:hypothetical protein
VVIRAVVRQLAQSWLPRRWRSGVGRTASGRGWSRWLAPSLAVSVGALVLGAPVAHADTVAYLVNVTVRPGYNFANADDAIAYGQDVCGKVTQGLPYGALIADLKFHFQTSDDYQAAYLINQAVNELCPAQIWQLRNSAAGYRGS